MWQWLGARRTARRHVAQSLFSLLGMVSLAAALLGPLPLQATALPAAASAAPSEASPLPAARSQDPAAARPIVSARIYLDFYHDQSGERINDGRYDPLINDLRQGGHTVDIHNEIITATGLANYDVLALIYPDTSFLAAEILIIEDWASRGGHVVVLSEWGNIFNTSTILNFLTSRHGITINSDAVIDPTNNIDGRIDWPVISNFAAHPLTAGMGAINLPRGASLTVAAPAIALASGDNDTARQLNAQGVASAEGKSAGPAPEKTLGVIVPGAPVVAAYAPHGTGDFFVVGDSNLWGNGFYQRNENRTLAFNVLARARSGGTTTRVYYDLFHDSAGDTRGQNTAFMAELARSGIVFEEKNEVISSQSLAGYDVLVISDPEGALSAAEISAIETFVSGGKRAVVLGEWGNLGGVANNLNPLIAPRGVTLNADTVQDPTNHEGNAAYWPVISSIASHALTNGVNALALYASASLTVAGPALALASGDSDTTRQAALQVAGESGNDRVGAGTTLGAVTPGAPVVAAYAPFGSGDIIVIGDSGLWEDQDPDSDGVPSFREYNNLTFARNVFGRSGAVLPSITVTPNRGPAGSQAVIAGRDFTPSQAVSFTFGGQPLATNPATVTTDASGAFANVTFTVPNVTPGDRQIVASQPGGVSASALFTVGAADDHGNTAQTATVVAVPSTTAGVLEVAGDVDFFRFPAVAGTTYRIETALGTLGDSVIHLYDQNGTTELAADDDGGQGLASLIVWTAPASGNYYVKVRAFGNSGTGSYTLSIATGRSLTLTPTSGSPGTTVTMRGGGWTPSQAVSFTFDGQALATNPATVTTDPSGAFSATFAVPNAASGAHEIAAHQGTAAATAAFTVNAMDDHGNTAQTATVVAVPSTTAGVLEVAGDVDFFRFPAVAGTTYRIETALGTLGDSVIHLYDQNGTTELAADDDGGQGLASLITWTAPASGNYYVKVRGFSASHTGSYTLRLSVELPCLAETPHPYPNNADLRFTITNPDPNATMTRVHFRQLATEFGADFVFVMDSGSNVLQRLHGDSAINGRWSRPAPGRTVILRFTSNATGALYGFCVDEVSSVAAPATVTATVFNPNPVVTSGDTTLRDNGNADSPVLTAQRVTVTLQDLDGSGHLSGPYADATGNGIPDPYKPAAQAYETGGVYDYTRSNDRFEEATAYYHVDATQRYLQSLGFTNANNRVTPIHAHYFPDANAFYSSVDGALHFGDAGVDFAEDADVVVHEYGHAVLDNIVDLQTAEGAALHEGFADYLAVTMFAEVNNGFQRECLGDWVGVPGCIRTVTSTKHYPEDKVGEPHRDGEMWSASLWQIRLALGRAAADKVIVEGLYFLNSQSGFVEAALAVLEADLRLNSGANRQRIREIFRARGILPDPAVTLTPASGAAGATAQAAVMGFDPSETITLRWDAANGAALATLTASSRGDGRVSFMVPRDAAAGRHQVFAVGAAANHTASASFAVGQATLVFQSDRDGNWEIYRMQADGSNVVRLTNHAAMDLYPDASPNGASIAFDSGREGGTRRIWVMNADGSNARSLTATAAPANDITPRWSPDGSRLAFRSTRDSAGGAGEIYVMNADGSGQTRLTTTAANQALPSWSPDGARIVFISNRDGNNEVYVMDANGANQRRITNTAASETWASFSPSGTQIIYNSNEDGDDEIYVSNLDGSGRRKLTDNTASDCCPHWSAALNQIAFVSTRDGNSELYLMNPDGSGQQRLTSNTGGDEAPRWGAFAALPPAPVPVVAPTVLDVTVRPGATATQTLTLRNAVAAGGQSLTFSVFDQPAAEPPTPPVAGGGGAPAAWGDGADAGAEAAPAPPASSWGALPSPGASETPAVTLPAVANLRTVINDPAGDRLAAGRIVDVVRVDAGSDSSAVTVRIFFTDDTVMSGVFGYVQLDTDQNRATGRPPTDLYGKPEQDIGFDFFVDLFDPAIVGVRRAADNSLVGTAPRVVAGQSLEFTIPLSMLDNDDGRMDLVMVVGDMGPADWAPDAGHGTINADVSWLSATPASGTIAPQGQQSIAVTLDATRLTAGVYTAVIAIRHNDGLPNPIVIPVTLRVADGPALALSPTAGGVGEQVSISGQFFSTSARITALLFDGAAPPEIAPALPLPLQGTAPNKTFSGLTFRVPAGAAIGPHTVTVRGDGAGEDNVIVSFTVTPTAVLVELTPTPLTIGVGSEGTMTIRVRSGEQRADGVDAVIQFDPTYLEVVDADPNRTGFQITLGDCPLPQVNKNLADNAAGTIQLSRGVELTDPPQSTALNCDLGIIRFRAKVVNQEGTAVTFVLPPDFPATKVSLRGVSQPLTARNGRVVAPAQELAFASQPVKGSHTFALGIQPVVELREGGQVKTGDNATVVTLRIKAATGTPGAALTCDQTQNGVTRAAVAAGVVSFTRCAIDLPGQGYVLEAAAEGASTGATAAFPVIWAGDASGDGQVDIDDYSFVASSYFKREGQTGYNARADLNGDRQVDIDDYSILASMYFTRQPVVTLSPATGPGGTQVTVTGTRYGANRTVTVLFDGVAVTTNPATVTADRSGNFTASFAVLANVGAGAHVVKAVQGTRVVAAAIFTVP